MAPSTNDFFTFIYHRQLIWHKRHVLQLPPPWTEDPVFREYKIINMYRELDRSTIYLMKKLEAVSSREAKLLNILFFRFFNGDRLYEKLEVEPFTRLDTKTKKKLITGFARMKKRGETLFNPAYLISPGASQAPKHLTILNHLQKVSKKIAVFVKCIDASSTPAESFAVLLDVPLAGPFLACEFWTDLAYVKFFRQGWTDNDFVNIGPGAKWGLEIMAGKKLNKETQWLKLRELYDMQEHVLPKIHQMIDESRSWNEIAYPGACSHVPFLSLTNMEGALCEFRKYSRLSGGKGRRRYFVPHINPLS